MLKNTVMAFAACIVAFTLPAGTGRTADNWPNRPVTIICPFAAGVSTDILTRAVAAALTEKLGQQFLVENRPGATGNIGAAAAAKAPPDGYTLLIGTLGPLVTNKFMYKNMSYDSERAFAPIMLLSSSPLVIVGSPKLPVTDLPGLITYARAHPNKVYGGTIGTGSQAHITLELINKLAGTSITHVPYRIGTQALPDLISGDLQVGFNYIPSFVPQVLEGTLRGLAVTTLQRTSYLPEVPTMHESGFPGFEASGWNALVAPAGTPRGIIEKINGIMNAFINSDSGKQQLNNIGMMSLGGTPEQLQDHLVRETAKWKPIVIEANISLQ